MKKKQKTLIDIVLKGDMALLREGLAQGVSPNETDNLGGTALMAAAKFGYEDKARVLLEAGADVNLAMSKKVSSTRGRTALIYAISEGQRKIAKLLVEAGANVNAETTWGESPLYEAARRGDLEMVKYLLAHGAKPTWVVPINAIKNRHAEILRVVLDAGADPNSKLPKTGETLLGEAVRFTKDSKFVLPLLESGARPNDITGRRCPLNYAAWDGNLELCDLLLKHGADVNKQDRFRRTPLMDAAFKGRCETVKFLLSKGAEIHLKDEDGKTAWDLAKEDNHTDVMALLAPSPSPKSRKK